MLVLGYFTEGIVRATTDTGLSQTLAVIEVLLALVLFVSCVAYARTTTPSPLVKPVD